MSLKALDFPYWTNPLFGWFLVKYGWIQDGSLRYISIYFPPSNRHQSQQVSPRNLLLRLFRWNLHVHRSDAEAHPGLAVWRARNGCFWDLLFFWKVDESGPFVLICLMVYWWKTVIFHIIAMLVYCRVFPFTAGWKWSQRRLGKKNTPCTSLHPLVHHLHIPSGKLT